MKIFLVLAGNFVFSVESRVDFEDVSGVES